MYNNEIRSKLYEIEEALHQYSASFVDWYELAHDTNYRPVFPAQLISAMHCIKLLRDEFSDNKQPKIGILPANTECPPSPKAPS